MKKPDVDQLKKRIGYKYSLSSQFILVLKFSVSQSYANKIIRAKNSIHCRTKVKFPKRIPQQKKTILYAQDVTVFLKLSRNWDFQLTPVNVIEDF